MYGAGGPKLASIAGYKESEGNKLKEVFYDRWPCIAELIKDLEHSYKVLGDHIVGLAGRKVWIREKRKLLNSLLQQGAAEIFKHWMVRCNRRIKSNGWPLYQVIAYHDELQFEWHSSDKGALDLIKDTLCQEAFNAGQSLNMSVPVAASGGIGKSWAETH